jgi:RNA polymerase sigma-70 factor (ECF subfamily)
MSLSKVVSSMTEGPGETWDWPLIQKRCIAEARRVLRSPSDAEDVVQEALVRAWRSQVNCRTPEAPLPWCLQITRNEALRLIGRRQRVVLDPLELGRKISDQRAEHASELALTQLDVARALETLSAYERRLIALRYVEDRSHTEIAAELKIPESTARVHLHRVHKRLRPLLRELA